MSAPSSAPEPSAVTNGARDLELDVSKLHSLQSEQQDLYLFNFVYELWNHVQSISNDGLPQHQASIKKEAIKIIGLASPIPGRVIRENLGRILADIFTRGSRNILYETINDLLAIINSSKGEREIGTKHIACVSLGWVFEAAGDSAISLSGLVVASLLKLLKPAQNHAGARASVFRALARTVTGLKGSIDDSVARDIWKQARSAASNDKAAVVQKSACLVLEALVRYTPYFNNSNDFENLKAAIWRALDSTAPAVRRSAADAFAQALYKACTDGGASNSVPIVQKPKKKGKKPATDVDEDVEVSRSNSPAPVKPLVRLSLSLSETLRNLSWHYCKGTTSRQARLGLALCYQKYLFLLPEKTVEERYSFIANHFFTEVINHPAFYHNRQRTLITRRHCQVLLEKVLQSRLSENGQINAARWLINDVIKNYPKVVQERREPPKRTLSLALSTLSSLIQCLGPAVGILQDSCREAIFQVMQHPNYTVQVYAARCARAFVAACPQQLLKCIKQCTSRLKKDLDPASEARHYHRKITGQALCISAMLSTSRLQPVFGSVDVFSDVLNYATDLLKMSSGAELRLSATLIQVAWILLGGLMTLGPSFVKLHLNQLLLLWRNALPRPLPGEKSSRKANLELGFLTHLRECALGSVLVFLEHNSALLTSDSAKRISVMLQNCLLFLDTLPNDRHVEDVASRLIPALLLQDHAIMLRRRLLQCFNALVSVRHPEQMDAGSQSDLAGLALNTFTVLENSAPKSLEASLAASASNFDGIWETEDNWAFGVTGLLQGYKLHPLSSRDANITLEPPWMQNRNYENLDANEDNPLGEALEHDALLLYCRGLDQQASDLNAAASGVINNAIKLFAISFPLQGPRIQESIVEQLATAISQPMQKEPGKKAAIVANISVALYHALRIAAGGTIYPAGKLAANTVGKTIAELLQKLVADPDSFIRNIGAQSLGFLCNISGSQSTSEQVKHLVDSIVSNRDPNGRAGCALALGCIHAEVGGMAAGLHLKSITGVLLSLCNDTHPIVHYWALRGLAQVADSSGLAFSSFATSTLGMLAQLYTSDSHTDAAASLATSNLEMEYSTPSLIGDCVEAVINVLGPDLQDAGRARNMIVTMIEYFQRDAVKALQISAAICQGHLSIYAPAAVSFSEYVKTLQRGMVSGDSLLEEISITGLNDLVRRNADQVYRVATLSYGDEIWLKLDQMPGHPTLQNILRSWMQQTYLTDSPEWVRQCQSILSKTRISTEPKPVTATATAKSAMPDIVDEEVAGFAAAAAAAQGETTETAAEGQEFLRWQTREFAMRLLSEMLGLVTQAVLPHQTIPAEADLQNMVGEIIRMAFSASTATVVDLRVWGLRIIDQILHLFGKTPDPDFLEASLLEQYQAQISSALTPAFAADSSPDLAAEAINVCATFVSTGIVTNVDRMGRIFKLLVTGLDDLGKEEVTLSMGDLKDISSNGQVMLKMAICSAWAQLLLASVEQHYLEDIVQPYVPRLAPLWLSSLQEFAALRFEPDISSSLGTDLGGNLDERYAAFNREIRLKYYQDNWLSLVDAIAVLVDKDSNAVFDALDRKTNASTNGQVDGTKPEGKDMSFREEPVAFFFILYGLAFEALVMQAREDPSQALAILQALQKILRPAVSGNAIYEDVVFTETTDTLNRLALTGGLDTQGVLVEISRNLSLDHLSAKSEEDRDEKLSEDIDQLFELTRIIILVLTGLVPTLEDPPAAASRMLNEQGIALVYKSFHALVDVAEIFPAVIRADLHSCIIHCYCTMLATGIFQEEVVPQIMPAFRSFLQDIANSPTGRDVTARLIRGCLSRMLMILAQAQRRENEFSIPCAKNTLLSITVLLSSAGKVLSPSDTLINLALAEVLDCLHDLGLAKVATNCVRSLLMTRPKSTCDEAVYRILFPQCLSFVCDQSVEDPEQVRPAVLHALVSSVQALSKSGRTPGMAVLIPILLISAKQTTPKGQKESFGKQAATRLLELARIDQLAFKTTAASLDDDDRAELGELLRSVGVGERKQVAESESYDDEKPAIELRMDF
jgi:HEAT repeat-containing protein 5